MFSTIEFNHLTQMTDTTGSSLDSSAARPLSAYNIFFQLEQNRVFAGTSGEPYTMKEAMDIVENRPVIPTLPQLNKLHPKSQGKFSFQELTRLLAKKWKALNPEDRQMFEGFATIGKQRLIMMEKKKLATSNKGFYTKSKSDDVGVTKEKISNDSSRIDINSSIVHEKNFSDNNQEDLKQITKNVHQIDEFQQVQQRLIESSKLIDLQNEEIQKMESKLRMFEKIQLQNQEILLLQQKEQSFQHEIAKSSQIIQSYMPFKISNSPITVENSIRLRKSIQLPLIESISQEIDIIDSNSYSYYHNNHSCGVERIPERVYSNISNNNSSMIDNVRYNNMNNEMDDSMNPLSVDFSKDDPIDFDVPTDW